jgi:hypothetical protein
MPHPPGVVFGLAASSSMLRTILAFLALACPLLAQQTVAQISFTLVPDYPPGMNVGEVPGAAANSQGHVFVFTRSNSATGPAFGAAAPRAPDAAQRPGCT